MKKSGKERKAAQRERKQAQRDSQIFWLIQNTPVRSAEAVISAAMRGECTITWNSGAKAAKGK